jgi:putative glutamine amidotransferase
VGFLSFPVPNGIKYSKTRHIDSWLEKLSPDAVVLSGGNDIAEFDSRDQVEKILINHAIHNSLPILGICRGMQMLGYPLWRNFGEDK